MKKTENTCFRYSCLLRTFIISLFLLIESNTHAQTLAARSLQLILPQGHSFGVLTMKFSPNGKWIATGSQDGTAKLWDAGTGKLLRTYVGHAQRIDRLEFTPDGRTLITTSWRSMGDGTTRVWDVITGRMLYSLNAYFEELLFAGSGAWMILVNPLNNELLVREIYSGQTRFIIKKEWRSFEKIRKSPDELSLVTSSHDSIRIWSLKNGELLKTFFAHEAVSDIQFSKDGKALITSSDEGEIKIWSYDKMELQHTLRTGDGVILNIKLFPKENKFLSEKDSSVTIWDLSTARPMHTLQHPGVFNFDISPDEKRLVASCADHIARLWDIKSGNVEDSIRLQDYLGAVAFSPKSDHILVSDGAYPKLWDIKTKTTRPIAGESGYSTVFDFSPDGRKLAASYADLPEGANSARIQLFDLYASRSAKTIEGSANLINYLLPVKNSVYTLLRTRQNHTLLWNMQTMQVQHAFNDKLNYFVAIVFSPDGKWMVTSRNDNKHEDRNPALWDLKTGEQIRTYDLRINDYAFPSFTPDGLRIMFPVNNVVEILEVRTGKRIGTLEGHSDIVNQVKLSPDGKQIATASNDRTICIWDAISFRKLAEWRGHKEYVYHVNFSPSGKLLCSAGGGNEVKVWEMASSKVLHQFTGVTKGVFLNKENWLGTSSLNGGDDVKIWDLATGQPVINLAGDHPYYFEEDSRIMYRDSVNGNYTLYDILEKKKLSEFPSETIRDIVFDPTKNHVLASYMNSEVKLFDAFSGRQIITTVFLDTTDYLALLPTGYYKSSPLAARQVHYTNPKLDIVGFEQLDIKYNRPDKVLQAIGSTDTALINSYKRAYLKRIKKLGVDTTAFSGNITIPEADFKNRNSILQDQEKKELQLQITGVSTTELDRFNIWINEVPLYGQKGVSLWDKYTASVDTTLTVILSEGENRVETSVTDANGIESYRYPLVVNYQPVTPAVPKKYFLGIGINKFAEKGNDLTWSVKDIRDLSKELSAHGFIIDTLFDKNVTREKIKALKEKLLHSNEEDKIVIAYSGHGLLSRNYDYYLSTYPVNFKAPEEQGLLYEEMESLLDGIKARRKLLLIDACHSGEVDKEEMSRRMLVENSLKQKGTKGGIVTYVGENRVGMINSFELMQELFVNIGRSTGATIISAAAGSQFALERGDLKNGVFTWCLLDAMKNKPDLHISVLKKAVIEKVPLLTNGLQKPTFRSETGQYDWELW